MRSGGRRWEEGEGGRVHRGQSEDSFASPQSLSPSSVWEIAPTGEAGASPFANSHALGDTSLFRPWTPCRLFTKRS